MNQETELRMKCLELASEGNHGSTERAVAAAGACFDFVMGRTPETIKVSSCDWTAGAGVCPAQESPSQSVQLHRGESPE